MKKEDEMNWLDILILVALVFSFIAGLTTGIVRGAVNLVGLIVGIILAGKFYTNVAGWLGFIHDTNISNIIGFVLILVVVMIIAGLVGGLLRKLVSAIMLGWLDHLLGGILGLLIGAITLGALLALWVKFFSPNVVSDSAIAKILLEKFPLVLNLLPSSFNSVKNFFK